MLGKGLIPNFELFALRHEQREKCREAIPRFLFAPDICDEHVVWWHQMRIDQRPIVVHCPSGTHLAEIWDGDLEIFNLFLICFVIFCN